MKSDHADSNKKESLVNITASINKITSIDAHFSQQEKLLEAVIRRNSTILSYLKRLDVKMYNHLRHEGKSVQSGLSFANVRPSVKAILATAVIGLSLYAISEFIKRLVGGEKIDAVVKPPDEKTETGKDAVIVRKDPIFNASLFEADDILFEADTIVFEYDGVSFVSGSTGLEDDGEAGSDEDGSGDGSGYNDGRSTEDIPFWALDSAGSYKGNFGGTAGTFGGLGGGGGSGSYAGSSPSPRSSGGSRGGSTPGVPRQSSQPDAERVEPGHTGHSHDSKVPVSAPTPSGGLPEDATPQSHRRRWDRIEGDPSGELVDVQTAYGHKIRVHPSSAKAFAGMFEDLKAVDYPMTRPGSHHHRMKRNGTGWSQHAHGNAVDINDTVKFTQQQKEWMARNPGKYDAILGKWGMVSRGGSMEWDEQHIEFGGTLPDKTLKELQAKEQALSGGAKAPDGAAKPGLDGAIVDPPKSIPDLSSPPPSGQAPKAEPQTNLPPVENPPAAKSSYVEPDKTPAPSITGPNRYVEAPAITGPAPETKRAPALPALVG